MEKKGNKSGRALWMGACLVIVFGLFCLVILVIGGFFLWNKLVLKRAEVAFSDLFSRSQVEEGYGEPAESGQDSEFGVKDLEREGTEVLVEGEQKRELEETESSSDKQTYENSQLGFWISYPEGWRVESTIDDYSTIALAEVQGGNHFHIYSYPADRYANPGLPVSSNELKVEVWLFENMGKSLNEWVGELIDVIKTEDMVIGGKKAIKVWQADEMIGQSMAIYYVDKNKGAMIISWPHDTGYSAEFDQIVQSFRFTD